MELNFQNRSFSPEEVNSVYQRWQQLEKQYGQNAPAIPEYVQLTQYLRAASRFKQLQQQQQQQQQAQQQAQQAPRLDHQIPQQRLPNSNIGNGNGNGNNNNNNTVLNNQQLQQPPQEQHQQHHHQQQQQQQQQQNTGITSIFSQNESLLLKAQISAFKSLMKNQPIPQDVSQFIINTTNILRSEQQQQQQHAAAQFQQPPIVAPPAQQQQQRSIPPTPVLQEKKMTQAQKRALKQQQQQAQQAQQRSQPPTPMQQHPHQMQQMVPPTPRQQYQPPPPPPIQQPQPQAQQPQQPQLQPPVAQAALAHPHQQQLPLQSMGPVPAVVAPVPPQRQIAERVPEPPVKIHNLSKTFPIVKSIIPIHDPTIQVDAFSVPIPPAAVDYDLFNNRSSRIIIPGVFPEGIDANGAAEMRDLVINLQIDEAMQKLSILKEKDIQASIDYEALSLLPLQRAMRGQLVGFMRYQNSLLTNSHPNFLAKAKSITINDILVTKNLYEQQKKLAAKIEQTKKIEKLNKLTESSLNWITRHTNKKERIARFGKAIASFHASTEREEARRIERNAKQRLQALKANDEEAYIKLLDQTKDTRITHLLRQTNAFLGSLAEAVKAQQRDTAEKLAESGHSVEDLEDEDVNNDNIDYYSVAHRINEVIVKQPSILVGGTLKEYQIKGLQWMVSLFNNHLNGILADEMGLGKTIQTISLLTYLVEVKKISGPFLVIVPLSTLTNWNMEFEKWAPSLKKITFKGAPTYRKLLYPDIKAQNFQVLLTTFEYVIKDKPLLSKIKWVHMIMDEGHRMKNAQSKLSYTLTQYYHSDYRLILTGTPLQNNLPELWALLNFVLPKIFNSVKSFDEWFNTPFANTGGQEKIGLSEEETLLVIRRLHKVLRPFLLRRLKKDVEKDLPNKVEKVVKCKMSALQSKLYQQMLKYNKLFVGDHDKNAVGVKGLNNQLMQLRKICNHPFVFEEVENLINPEHETNSNIWRVSGKFELLDKVLPKLKATGHRVLIFFQMTQVMDIMEDFLRLKDMKYLRLDGGTKADDRQEMLKVFNAPNSEYFTFLLSTRAGGLGLNLQTADTVIIFDSDWNPHQDLQAQDRAHRIGQKNEVRILRLITEDSIEEIILERAHQKLDIDGKVIQAGKFDNKSTAEEQEALLRALIEAEEHKKNGNAEDDEMNDSELNEVLSRSEEELILFKDFDDQRAKTPYGKNRLFSEAELPDVYNQDPELVFNKKDETIYGRGTRERKTTFYDENMSEAQWLKQFEESDSDNNNINDDDEVVDDDEDNEKKTKIKRKRGRQPKSKASTPLEAEEDSTVGRKRKQVDDGFVIDDEEDSEFSNKRAKTASKRAVKTTGRRGRGGGAFGRGVGRAKSITPFNRPPPSVPLTDEERKQLQLYMLKIYNYVHKYEDNGRRLSDIFLQKPSKKFYPDYYKLIKYPIAFDVISKRINKVLYNDLTEFMEDIHVMFTNAKTYNQEGSLIFLDAVKLENLAIEKFKVLTGKDINFEEFDLKYGLKTFNDSNATENIENGEREQDETNKEDLVDEESKSPN
ncbi:hypothetical protein PACTADRAFT_48244 [Pachysolen tannophilus NRRL Y-2460]|uniref:Uncharacterized protein n=1 Tax=Pachysolen tannophilus NRRL Y-2460 TaxID=669874 RepID=A0A1E4U3A8_PACTA|nr:hypothetical protein PACTADRAFT_48244 [Pachysolen tannophilus NRRL Y-2460]